MLLDTLTQIRLSGRQYDLFDIEVVKANLVRVYHTIVASESLLHYAIQESKDMDQIAYFESHLIEETGHAEMLAEDLASVGIPVDKLRVPDDIRCMVGGQYYSIFHEDPVSLFGYMLALEFSPTPLALVEELENKHGKELFRAVRHHAVHDIDHSAELVSQISKLSPLQQKIVEASAVRTATFLSTAVL